jgi:hypothetical protein
MKGHVSRISVDKSGHPNLCLFGPEHSPSERTLPKNIGHEEIHPNFTVTMQLGQSDMWSYYIATALYILTLCV